MTYMTRIEQKLAQEAAEQWAADVLEAARIMWAFQCGAEVIQFRDGYLLYLNGELVETTFPLDEILFFKQSVLDARIVYMLAGNLYCHTTDGIVWTLQDYQWVEVKLEWIKSATRRVNPVTEPEPPTPKVEPKAPIRRASLFFKPVNEEHPIEEGWTRKEGSTTVCYNQHGKQMWWDSDLEAWLPAPVDD